LAKSELGNYIAIRYNHIVAGKLTTADYQALAELRYRIRHFLRDGDAVARTSGLEPQQYLMLLMIRGLPKHEEASIRTLAERMALKHHSAVELVDRLEAHGYVHRSRGRDDRRRVLVTLLPRGERVLEQVARRRIDELHSHGRELARAIGQLLQAGNRTGSNHTKRSTKKARGTRE
jgi:DNA-binding MarR family transcriptional regulator